MSDIQFVAVYENKCSSKMVYGTVILWTKTYNLVVLMHRTSLFKQRSDDIATRNDW